jgi:beta-glucanase (GH16 family)
MISCKSCIASIIWANLAIAKLNDIMSQSRVVSDAPSEWVDPDTPSEPVLQQGAQLPGSSSSLSLVFSDEFNVPGRYFQDGHDSMWTALTGNPTGNNQVNSYVDFNEIAQTVAYEKNDTKSGKKGVLRLGAAVRTIETMFDNGNGAYASSKNYFASAMLQTWNKFCFSEGVIEMSGQLPGSASQNGLWPAFWLMGNLGRATIEATTNKVWPWSYSYCPSSGDTSANQDPRNGQAINACMDSNGQSRQWASDRGLEYKQGRGAIEIDIIEALPGTPSDAFAYCNGDIFYDPVCADFPVVPPATCKDVNPKQPLVMTSLQMAPGIPCGSKRPPEKSVCVEYNHKNNFPLVNDTLKMANCLPKNFQDHWYAQLAPGTSNTYGLDFTAGPNKGFWGSEFKQVNLVTDAISAIMDLPTAGPSDAFSDFHTYALDWKAKSDNDAGHLYFTFDGKKQFYVDGAMVEKPYPTDSGTLQGRKIPDEAAYILLNIDISEKWGWPPSDRCNPDDPKKQCCVDCNNATCVTLRNGQTQWFTNFCSMIGSTPAYYYIDYIRIWQPSNSKQVVGDCSPKAKPTQGWIHHKDNSYKFNEDVHNEPLKPVFAGGAPCTDDSACGGDTTRGQCKLNQNKPCGGAPGCTCKCTDAWTGPSCKSRRVGNSKKCEKLYDAVVGGASCFTKEGMAAGKTSVAADCGFNQGRGKCVLVDAGATQKAAGDNFFEIAYMQMVTPDGMARAGGGDGRCQCNDGWGGHACDKPDVKAPCSGGNCPMPSWPGTMNCSGGQHCSDYKTLDNYIRKTCSSSFSGGACNDVLWSQQGSNTYVDCGYYPRAIWLVKHGSGGVNIVKWVIIALVIVFGICIIFQCCFGGRLPCCRRQVAEEEVRGVSFQYPASFNPEPAQDTSRS